MAPQAIRQRSLKERNAQRRKRSETLELKVADMAVLCDYDAALIMRNRETGEVYSFRSSDSWRPNMEDILTHPKSRNKLPRDIEKIKRKKERQRLKGMRKRAGLHSEDQASNEDEPDGWVTKAAPFLPEPPSFDATLLRKACVN